MEETPLLPIYSYMLTLWSHLGVLGVLYGTMACSSCGVTLYTNQKYSKKSEMVYNINIRASPPTRTRITHASFCQKHDALDTLWHFLASLMRAMTVSWRMLWRFPCVSLTFPLRFSISLYLFLHFLLFVFNYLSFYLLFFYFCYCVLFSFMPFLNHRQTQAESLATMY